MDSHDAEEAYAKVTLFEKSDTEKEQKEAEQAYQILRQFESAHTDSEQKEAMNKVERLLATCDDGDLVFDTIVVLRQMCVKKNLGQKFNEWREKYMQRAEREDPTPEELWYSPCNSKSELMEWLQKTMRINAPLSCCAEKFKMELQRRSKRASNPFLVLL